MKSPRPEKPITQLVNIFQSLKENDFSKQVVKPLFEKEFDSVDFHGGPGEMGRDLICTKKTRFDDLEIAVVQVKKLRITAASKDPSAFGGLITQLHQAIEAVVHLPDGTSRRPNRVFFITPFPITMRALQSRFEKYQDLRRFGVTIYDGIRIAELLNKVAPEIASQFLRQEVRLETALSKHLNNKDLLDAMNFQGTKNISHFYCDLNFAVGKITTKFFFSINLSQCKPFLSPMSQSEFTVIEENVKKIESSLSDPIFQPAIKNINNAFTLAEKEARAKREQATNRARQQIEDFCKELCACNAELEERRRAIVKNTAGHEALYQNMSSFCTLNAALIEFLQTCRTELSSALTGKRKSSFTDLRQSSVTRLQAAEENQRQLETQLNWAKEHKPSVATAAIRDIIASHFDFLDKTSEPQLNLRVLANRCAERIKRDQCWIRENAEKASKGDCTLENLRQFILRCEEAFSFVELLFENPLISRNLWPANKQRFTAVDKLPTFSISAHRLFDTRLPFSVLGDAGSGKSTTLQMYAKKSFERGDEGHIVMFLPLAKCFQGHIQSDRSTQAPLTTLENAITSHLASLGIEVENETLREYLENGRGTIIFDGVDEVIKIFPGIIAGITAFHQKFRTFQVITSSRVVATLLNHLPFVGITLLPFDDRQQRKFIKGWFHGSDPHRESEISKHLDRNLNLKEIVRNPLLATILCVLAENGAPLPDSEVRLYEERLRLLLNVYDTYKKAKRIQSPFWILNKTALCLAMALHRENKRFDTKDALIETAVKNLAFADTKSNIVRAVDELVDPCNVLVPMTTDGDFGFGHLRYQEYLAACELSQNRNIDVFSLLENEWWKGVLTFFAKMGNDLVFLIDKVSASQNSEYSLECLLAMIGACHVEQRQMLESRLRKGIREWLNRGIIEPDKARHVIDREPGAQRLVNLRRYLDEYSEEDAIYPEHDRYFDVTWWK